LMKSFPTPILARQLGGQPIEKFGMARLGSHQSKIARCIAQPATKMLMPDPIGNHACELWMIRACQPASQGRSSSSRGGALFGRTNSFTASIRNARKGRFDQ